MQVQQFTYMFTRLFGWFCWVLRHVDTTKLLYMYVETIKLIENVKDRKCMLAVRKRWCVLNANGLTVFTCRKPYLVQSIYDIKLNVIHLCLIYNTSTHCNCVFSTEPVSSVMDFSTSSLFSLCLVICTSLNYVFLPVPVPFVSTSVCGLKSHNWNFCRTHLGISCNLGLPSSAFPLYLQTEIPIHFV